MHAEAQQYGAEDIVSEEGRVKSEEFNRRKNLYAKLAKGQ